MKQKISCCFFMVIKRKLIGCCAPSKTGCARLIIMKIVSQMTFLLVKKSLFGRSFTSVTQCHLISIREDKEGDANPTLLVAELK